MEMFSSTLGIISQPYRKQSWRIKAGDIIHHEMVITVLVAFKVSIRVDTAVLAGISFNKYIFFYLENVGAFGRKT